MPKLVVPHDINNLSMDMAFCCYRDQMKLHVYPVYGPQQPITSKCAFPGKQPRLRCWWDYSPQDVDIRYYFIDPPIDNIGMCPKVGVVLIDLDSKQDQGVSVQKYLAEHPKLGALPRHRTYGGAHLLLICSGLPLWTKRSGKPFHNTLKADLGDGVTAEFIYSDHSNIVLPPSAHPKGGTYRWEVTGEVPALSWKEIQGLCGFEEPFVEPKSRNWHKKGLPWHFNFQGDLASLDLIALLDGLGISAILLDPDEAKYSISCPWRAEHSTDYKNSDADSSTAIWQSGDANWPGFRCLHAHCKERGLKELLEWAEGQQRGIVDRFCVRKRTWEKGQKSAKGCPRILHPCGRLESEVHEEIAEVIAPAQLWFRRSNEIVTVARVPSGFDYSSDPNAKYKIAFHTTGLRELTAIHAKSSMEQYIEPGYLAEDEQRGKYFVPKSFSTDFCCGLLQSDVLKDRLPLIARILTTALPFRIGNQLVYPKEGYDPRFGTYLLPDTPQLKEVSLERALEVMANVHSEFCFTTEQSRTHAIARLITPFARALLGWTTRVPLWFYSANRPRAGKDYLSGVTLIVYEGHAFEDLPIGKEFDETGKRIMAAARSGRRFMHFSNCQIHLADQCLTQALTNPVINGRRLGSNDASSDLSIPNEMEYSLSANVGLTYREDLEPRMRKIELAYFEEDPNTRVFKNRFLHRSVLEHRTLILSAVASLYRHWAQEGFPPGPSPFVSYPQWAEVIGGVMVAAGLGDPCLPFQSDYDTGGDLKTTAMAELFKVCHETLGEKWVRKKEIYQCVQKAVTADDNELLGWFGALEGAEDSRKNQSKLGRLLKMFKNRVLLNIRLAVDESSAKSERHQYRFVPAGATPKPAKLPESGQNNQKSPPEVGTSGTLGTSKGSTLTRGDIPFDAHACACDVKNTSLSANEPLETPKVPDVPTCFAFDPPFYPKNLALDLETYGAMRLSKIGKPLKGSVEALSPWKGDIRLVTLADDDSGAIFQCDLRSQQIPKHILDAISRGPLVIHHAAFDLSFLAVKLGLSLPDEVFCTLTASRLLEPSRQTKHRLGDVVERWLGVRLAKELGASDWGAEALNAEQMEYACNDVHYLHPLKNALETALANAGLTRVFELESQLIPIIARMEHRGFAVDPAALQQRCEEAEQQQEMLGMNI